MIIEIKHKGVMLSYVDTSKLSPKARRRALEYGVKSMIADAAVTSTDESSKRAAMMKKLREMLKSE